MSDLEASGVRPGAEVRSADSLLRRGIRDVVAGGAVWLLYRWLVHDRDVAAVSPHNALTALTVIAVWVAGVGFVRGRGDRRARRVAVAATVVAAGAFGTVLTVRPSLTGWFEAPTPALSGLMMEVAAVLGLWARHSERRRAR